MQLKTLLKKNNSYVFIKAAAAFLLSVFRKRRNRKQIVLIGGNRGERYEDNAAVFHQYLIRTYGDRMDIFWLYDPASPHFRSCRIEKAVPLGSFRNYLLFFQADYSFHSHSIIYDIAPGANRFLFLNRKTVFVHISHGIESFKKLLVRKEDVPLLRRTNYFNCASGYEKQVKLKKWGVPEHKLIVTGFPRFDRYVPNRPSPQIRNILLMLTWREWLLEMDEQAFRESLFYKKTTELISHPGIRQLLDEQDLDVTFVLHPFMKRYEDHFTEVSSDRIRFTSIEDLSFDEVIPEMDLLLTDMTSVSWDFLYLNRPIIFYLFDEEDWERKRGLYFDLDKDLYGYRVKTIGEVLGCLREVTAGGVTFNKWHHMAGRYIDFYDQRNCERLAKRVFGGQ